MSCGIKWPQALPALYTLQTMQETHGIPKWLEHALNDPEWELTQREAWEGYLSPERFGRPVPLFVEILPENRERFLCLLIERCQLFGFILHYPRDRNG
jgi:hypothetical protein